METDAIAATNAALRRVYLIESHSRLERNFLESWVAKTHKPEPGREPIVASLDDPGEAHADRLRQALAEGRDCSFIPVRALWVERQRRGGNLARVILGDSRRPAWLRQQLIYRSSPERLRPLVAEPATLSELQRTLSERDPQAARDPLAMTRFIRRQAILALERAERNQRGARYKVPRMLEEEVLSKPRLVSALAEEAERSGRPLSEVMHEARECLHEMAPRHSALALDIMAALGRYLYTRGFDQQIDVSEADLERIRRLGKRHSIAFLMTHKSHIDGFLLFSLFHDLNMPPVHLFGGINMSFLGLGALGKRSGAIFIRRTMTGDNVYKAVFKQYIDYLAEKRFPLLWALEGTRSRTGKLMPPRYGLISYVVESYVRSANTDMILMPVAIAYDQVPEVRDYIAEHRGLSKRPESASWFMQYISGLRNPFGKIHVRFGEGVQLSDVLGEPHPELQVSALDVQKIAFRLAVDANRVTPIVGTGLITFALGAAGRKAMTHSELARELLDITRLVQRFGFPTVSDVEISSRESLDRMLGQLVHNGVLARYDGAEEPLYAIAGEAVMAAGYYRNGVIHFLMTPAIAELALLCVASDPGPDPIERLHTEALRIRDILKFDFFFPDKNEFTKEIDSGLDLRAPRWREIINEGRTSIYTMLWELRPLLAPGALRPFLDSYLVVAEALRFTDETPSGVDEKSLLRKCMTLGRERALQQRIGTEESAAKVYLENGLSLARSRGLLGPGDRKTARIEFHEEIRTLTRHVAIAATLAENRRLGIETPALELRRAEIALA